MESELVTLPNGLRVVLCPMPAMQSASIAVFVGLGSRYEDDALAGVSHVIEHMMFKGTRRRATSRQIAETLDAVGGVINASTDKELTVYWAKVARTHLPLAADLLSDMLLESRLRESDLAREKTIITEELAALIDDPQEWVHVLLDEILWPRHPLGREIAGSRESVERLTRKDVLSFYRRFYGPNNAVVSIAGGVDRGEALALAEQCLGRWEPVTGGDAEPAPQGFNGPQVLADERPMEQVSLAMAYPGAERGHPDRWAIDLLCTILGGGASSRLFTRLREELGLVYDVQMYATRYSDTGAIVVSAGTDAAHVTQSLEAVAREIDRVQSRRIPEAELQRAKQFYRGRLSLGLEDTHAVASWFGAQEMLHGHMMRPEEAADRIDAVSASDLLRVARQYLSSAEMRLATVGPVSPGALDRAAG